MFPEFTPEVASDLRTSLELSLDEMLESDAADYPPVSTERRGLPQRPAGESLWAKLPDDSPFQKVDFEPEHRAGVLSHPYLLASLAYTSASSPIHRGVFLSRSVLGRVLRPPAASGRAAAARSACRTEYARSRGAADAAGSVPGLPCDDQSAGFHDGKLRRHRPLSRIGAQITPIDATGSYLTQSRRTSKSSQGMKDLAAFLAASEESQTAFVKQLFHHTVKQPILAVMAQTRLHRRASAASDC